MRRVRRMSRSKWKVGVIALIAVLVLSLAVVMYLLKEKPEPTELMENKKIEISAWLVDWKWHTGLDDLTRIGEGLESLQLFAAYFDHQDKLYFTEDMLEGTPEILKELEGASSPRLYMTVVNDIWNEDGSSIQKDTALVTRLTATEASRHGHIEQLLQLAEQYELDGIELDYERIDEKDWDDVIRLITELYGRLSERGRSLRVILEPRAPLERLTLPTGPEYVMMAYNLYGTHSGPGPKADPSFIQKQAQRMKQLEGEHVIALAAGGFDWEQNGEGKVKSVTEKQANELTGKHKATPVRDEVSGSLYFKYSDEQGVDHIVWYADHVTLSQWVLTAQQEGLHKIALWRLGELGDGTLRYLHDFRKESL